MAVPKRKTSKSSRDKRRSHDRVIAPNVTLCSNCKEPKLSHIVCPKCGYYKGKQYLKIGEA
ncbi:MAG TPA: 50S ribosomal protein L32 [Syntrophorhabdus sp.]|jgi:large subunit ribosomal protein L32|nr:50S ribosomal protein L32 [Syntrophorhabdus sp.]MDI9559520.1 50S ribosomal protein L32 [Pseudomonadota bacterium]OPX97148.1 MAG: 50S ribosomal protein L32 [Syntrophorhabdus sp. PtaB.Bin027]OQB75776.1 MAG: 50S ribosomal protein L32 [Deltaproteobacteria bacterium ADurb.Bin135]MBP8744957.1 50S ribosomal protein L32 [Syntrophorhabdus sp.]